MVVCEYNQLSSLHAASLVAIHKSVIHASNDHLKQLLDKRDAQKFSFQ